MRLSREFWKWLVLAAVITGSVTLTVWCLHRFGPASAVPQHTYELQTGKNEDWEALGGQWSIANGIIYNDSPERGAKLLTGSSSWRNYTLTADIRFTGANADMGVVVRVNDAREGADTYNGYYIGLRTLDGTMVVGRSDFGWREAHPVPVPGGIQPNVWYRMRVTVFGCDIAASAQNLDSLQTAWIAFRESDCLASGRIGLRSLNAKAMWRNISIAPATWNDYLELRKHAPSLEHPEVLPGPPWWTPWHAGILFGSILVMVFLTQLIYFRMQQWKTYTITRERERLAHDIHDTMAQSFAGIGYQIQGIYHNLLRGGQTDPSEIANQLNVAYQLVHRCHEEASRTIAMLGSTLPFTPQNLLETLTETAKRIAGDKIKIIAESHGVPSPLSLRLTDALLHIGQEAIANAVSHSGLNTLSIRLIYNKKGVMFAVEDNGKGFYFSPDATGFGILGMQKRARDVGATLQIISIPGHGTKVQVIVEVQDDKTWKRMSAKTGSAFFTFCSGLLCRVARLRGPIPEDG